MAIDSSPAISITTRPGAERPLDDALADVDLGDSDEPDLDEVAHEQPAAQHYA